MSSEIRSDIMANEFQPKTEDLSEYHPSKFGEDNAECHGLHSLTVPTLGEVPLEPSRFTVSDYGEECFLLKGVLTQKESEHFIKEGEKLGFAEILGVKKSYRNCQRILIESQEVSDLLWKRIQPFLTDVSIDGDPHDVHIHGISSMLQGTWAPSSLNNIFRLCRYEPGGHFAPHFDGHIVKTSTERSMKTLMLYLNEDFTGGSTNFINEEQRLYMDESGKFCAEEKYIVERVQPTTGMAIIFNHHRLHEGSALTSGVKYILRTDIMYTCADKAQYDPTEEEALQIVQEAERLEGIGETMKAMELYRKAFKMSPSLAASYGS